MDGIGRSARYHKFFQECSARFSHVVYVFGNHEHYNGDFATSGNKLKSLLESNMLSNVYLLDKETKVIDDVTFIGGTLWTDMNKEDPITLHSMTRMMNDFRCVDNSNRVVNYRTFDDANKNIPTFRERVAIFSPEDAVTEHKDMLAYIKEIVSEKYDQKFVVVGHHAPSRQSTHPRYKDKTIMNGGYSSDLTDFILDRPQIKAWTHGHTHELFDYNIGSTRVICNPRGYVLYERDTDEKQPYLPHVFEV
jgi:DNA repair exonuclease SbcCD nuclease subunit